MRWVNAMMTVAWIGVAAVNLTGCPNKGPAQKAGEKIDSATDKISDTVNPKGPAEKAGRSIDRATDN